MARPDSPNDQPTSWLHVGTLPIDTSVGDLASFITESAARGVWPFAARFLKSDGGCSVVAVGARGDPPPAPYHRLSQGGEGCRTSQGCILTGPW